MAVVLLPEFKLLIKTVYTWYTVCHRLIMSLIPWRHSTLGYWVESK